MALQRKTPSAYNFLCRAIARAYASIRYPHSTLCQTHLSPLCHQGTAERGSSACPQASEEEIGSGRIKCYRTSTSIQSYNTQTSNVQPCDLQTTLYGRLCWYNQAYWDNGFVFNTDGSYLFVYYHSIYSLFSQGELEHRSVKRHYSRTNKINHTRQIANHQRRERVLHDAFSRLIEARQEEHTAKRARLKNAHHIISSSRNCTHRLEGWLQSKGLDTEYKVGIQTSITTHELIVANFYRISTRSSSIIWLVAFVSLI